MIKFEKIEVFGWDSAIRGMRNARESWLKSTSEGDILGDEDSTLMKNLIKAGPSHSKFRRMIVVYVDITAPLFWWKEFDTYKIGTVANSCSSIWHAKKRDFTIKDFDTDYMNHYDLDVLMDTITRLNKISMEGWTKDKDEYVWKIQRLLPMCYLQKRTVMLNYEVLATIYGQRKHHILPEWKEFCNDFIHKLPNSFLIEQ